MTGTKCTMACGLCEWVRVFSPPDSETSKPYEDLANHYETEHWDERPENGRREYGR